MFFVSHSELLYHPGGGLPILLLQRFGVGMLVYLPYAITGLFVEYYFELVAEHNLTSYWGVIGWCALGLAIGLSADLAYRYLPAHWSPRLAGDPHRCGDGLGQFPTGGRGLELLLTWCLSPAQARFWAWLIMDCPCLPSSTALAGYTAYAISQHV